MPGAIASVSAYPGTDRTEPYSERVLVSGTVLHQARVLLDRLTLEAVGVTDKSTGGSENVQKYPVRALQEAIVNALVHRDDASREPTRVVVYADRVEVGSPGGLDHRISKSRFLRGDAHPVWRNRSLAWVFIKLQLAQAEGQGIPTIQRSLAHEGSAPAHFEVSDDSVVCTLPAHPRHARVRDLMRAELALTQGQFQEAIRTLEALLREDPFNPRTASLLAEARRYAGDPAPITRLLSAQRSSLARFPAATRLVMWESLRALGVDADPSSADLVHELLAVGR